MSQLSYKLKDFEGPLDLLLHLVSRHKVDILDVPILEIIGQYLQFIRSVAQEDLDAASSFLEMAARLVYMKSLSLLPRQDELEDLTQELREEILGYRDCKMLADMLREQAKGFDYFTRGGQESYVADMTYQRLHEPSELVGWYLAAVGRKKRKLPPSAGAFSGIIAHKIVSVSGRVKSLLDYLIQKGSELLDKLLRSSKSRSELVATFLAILALTKSRNLVLEQHDGKITAKLLKSEWVDDGAVYN
ncbi:MAG: segregation/condensation protein A [Oscillospiraceae bacterium]|nr:segregation/condensation protein A [Oscillospiraceae bacterium]